MTSDKKRWLLSALVVALVGGAALAAGNNNRNLNATSITNSLGSIGIPSAPTGVNKAAIIDGNNAINSSTTTSTELGYLSGTTSSVQTQLNSKLAAANNLSDVNSSSTSFNNISGFTLLGDTHYGGASGVRSVLPGNTSGSDMFYVQGGHGSTSSAPSWRLLQGKDMPNPSSNSLGGVQSFAQQANQFLVQISNTGVVSAAQPGFNNLSGSLGSSQMPALTGDVTTPGGSLTTTIAANAVTNSKLATMNANTVKANVTGSSANPTDVALTSASTGSAAMIRDSSGNVAANDFEYSTATTLTSGATTTLNSSSPWFQEFTGISTQQINLPDTSTLKSGQGFMISNRSTGVITVKTTGGTNLVQTMAGGSILVVTCMNQQTNNANAWDDAYSAAAFAGDGNLLISVPSQPSAASGNNTASLGKANANAVWAGSTSSTGQADYPTYRQLVPQDVKSLYLNASHNGGCSWARTNTAFGDPASSACTFSTQSNVGFNVVPKSNFSGSPGNLLPGIIFTPPNPGAFLVCVSGDFTASTTNANGCLRLWDGTYEIGSWSLDIPTGGNTYGFSFCGITNNPTAAQETVTIQTKISSGSITINNVVNLDWSITQIGGGK